ncbi:MULTISPECIES: ParB/RepB/Spo0J family partition protein [Legionella]|uniref:Probable chromosome-partitioning protein ParB n=1 Tax=Legionella septentrionalis TaxID=2498109 RepID=A0A3S0V5P6_9GAMM|nr:MULTISPECIES: ParB/RepB/Spo0J family partition protein [Legionella]MCP0914872.1 ParB/RepB/Spo0J family partition protein [Legionella sp. 27cVA30]RUQ88822.1 ParB/RepB/Spo0J family partition protein [Legionella septentrionalis]RUR11534.1 ParB/RepB/Spo0J family partition protein [Legionella septentrionalis]RUR16799.1 ParB/RepB/Spo0J family partition protein [Legionella septentrionalis]
MVKKGGLGRSLSALLSHTESATPTVNENSHQVELSVHCLQPGKYQPRGEIDEISLAELADSIKKQGLLQPLVVREVAAGQYEIIAGERRWRACQLAGMAQVPVTIRQVDDETAMAMALVENLQREDLNVMDHARALQRLTTEFALTHQQVAEVIGKSRTAVSNYLRLLNLNPAVRRMLENGDLDMGHARCLLVLDETQQSDVAKLIVARNLSVRETEALVARVKTGAYRKDTAEKKPLPPVYSEQLQSLAQHLQTKVSLKQGKSGKGTLVLHYQDVHALEKMMDLLMSN